MKIVKCGKCGEEYSSELEECPKCGSKKRTNLFKFFIKMCFLLLLLFIITSLSAISIGNSVVNNKYGLDAITEVFLGLLVIIIILMSGNSYVFTGKKNPFISSLLTGMPIILITLMSFAISIISINGPVDKGNLINLLLFSFAIGGVEELLFRGWLLNEFLEKFSSNRKQVITSIILSGLIFGLVHIVNISTSQSLFETIIEIIEATSLGILFSSIYYQTKNIWACITLHAAYDFAIMLGSVNLIKDCTLNNAVEPAVIIYETFAALVVVLIYILSTTIILSKSKVNKLVKEKEEITKEEKKQEKKNNALAYYCIIILEIVLISLQFITPKGIDSYQVCYNYEKINIENYETHYYSSQEFSLISGNKKLRLYHDKANRSIVLRNDQINYGISFEESIENYITNYEVIENEQNYLIVIAYSNNIDATTIKYIIVDKNKINNSVESLNEIKENVLTFDLPLIKKVGYLTKENENYKNPIMVTNYDELFIIDNNSKLFIIEKRK